MCEAANSVKSRIYFWWRGACPEANSFAATLNARDIRILRYDVDARNRILLHGLDDLLA